MTEEAIYAAELAAARAAPAGRSGMSLAGTPSHGRSRVSCSKALRSPIRAHVWGQPANVLLAAMAALVAVLVIAGVGIGAGPVARSRRTR